MDYDLLGESREKFEMECHKFWGWKGWNMKSKKFEELQLLQKALIGLPHSQKKAGNTPTLSPFIDHSRNITLVICCHAKYNIDLPQKASHTHYLFN